jgi:hypothetical protein
MADSLGRVVSRRLSAWQKVVALAPALLLMAYLPAEAMLRCRIDGTLRSACCCPAKKEAPSSHAAFRAADCCDRAVVGAHQRPAMEGPRAPEVEHVLTSTIAPVAALTVPTLAPAARIDWAAQRHGPPREGPSLVLLKQAFLI